MKIKLIITSILAAIGLISIYMMSQLPEIRGGGGVGPGFFPIILGALLFILTAAQTFITAVTRGEGVAAEKSSKSVSTLKVYFRPIMLLLGIIAYALLFNIVGFPIMTFLMIFLMGILLEKTHLKFKVLFSLGFTVFAWVIFKLMLGIPLPAGILSVIL